MSVLAFKAKASSGGHIELELTPLSYIYFSSVSVLRASGGLKHCSCLAF